jgi:hypothetical protein
MHFRQKEIQTMDLPVWDEIKCKMTTRQSARYTPGPPVTLIYIDLKITNTNQLTDHVLLLTVFTHSIATV